MGQAKRRGSYEQRKALAIERDKDKPINEIPMKRKSNFPSYMELMINSAMKNCSYKHFRP